MSQPIKSKVLKCGGKSLIEWFWGTLLFGGGIFSIIIGIAGIGIWAGLLGAAMAIVGLLILSWFHQATFDGGTRLWSETSGLVIPIWHSSGSFDELQVIHVATERGKVGPFHKVWICLKKPKSSPLLYEVVHSETALKEIIAQLSETLSLEVKYSTEDPI